jgi:hypothetical protein
MASEDVAWERRRARARCRVPGFDPWTRRSGTNQTLNGTVRPDVDSVDGRGPRGCERGIGDPCPALPLSYGAHAPAGFEPATWFGAVEGKPAARGPGSLVVSAAASGVDRCSAAAVPVRPCNGKRNHNPLSAAHLRSSTSTRCGSRTLDESIPWESRVVPYLTCPPIGRALGKRSAAAPAAMNPQKTGRKPRTLGRSAESIPPACASAAK